MTPIVGEIFRRKKNSRLILRVHKSRIKWRRPKGKKTFWTNWFYWN